MAKEINCYSNDNVMDQNRRCVQLCLVKKRLFTPEVLTVRFEHTGKPDFTYSLL